MVFISNLPPAGGGAPLANVQPQAVLQAQSAQSASPTAQQILPQAVVASAMVPGYASETPKPPKPILRAGSTPQQPSSPLAAQMLAQSPELSDEQLAVFAPRTPTNAAEPPPPEPEFLAQLRLARGDITPPLPQEQARVATTLAQATSTQMVATQATQNSAVLGQAVSSAPAPRQSALHEQRYQTPPVQQSIAGRKSSLALTRGAASYALTEWRNALKRDESSVEAVV